MNRYASLFFLIIICSRAFCQYNDSIHYHIKYGASGSINRTSDARSFILSNALAFNISKKTFSLNSSNQWIYGRQNTQLINNDFSSGFNFDILKELQRLYYWGLASYTSSYSLKIKYQFQGGAGIGYNIFNTRDLELVISEGLLAEASDLQVGATGREIYQTFRNSLRLKHRWAVNNFLEMEGTHFWQPSLSSFSDYIIRSSLSLSIKLRKWLNVTAASIYNTLSRTKRENLFLNFGLTADTYF